jgi:hypothetical protein
MVMADGTEATAPGVISRRDVIVGGLALAAGALIAAKPEEAMAINGDTVEAGELTASQSPTFLLHTDSGALLSPESSWALLAGSYAGIEYGLEGRVFAHSAGVGVGVHGSAQTVSQYGVLAENTASGGIALKVNGLAQFSRSGKATIAKGHTSKTVSGLSNISTGSMILVTLQGSAGTGRYVRYAKRASSTSFTVYLNTSSAYDVSFAWMILN